MLLNSLHLLFQFAQVGFQLNDLLLLGGKAALKMVRFSFPTALAGFHPPFAAAFGLPVMIFMTTHFCSSFFRKSTSCSGRNAKISIPVSIDKNAKVLYDSNHTAYFRPIFHG
jgi:hypothetical protein